MAKQYNPELSEGLSDITVSYRRAIAVSLLTGLGLALLLIGILATS